MPGIVIDAVAAEFARYRKYAEEAAGRLTWPQLREPLDRETNSVAVIMKHVGGNLRSRWTDPFTTDGEKPWRNRDREFIDDFPSGEPGRAALDAVWLAGWSALGTALASISDPDLPRALTIRGEPHTLALALSRSLSHTAYHAGQIVQTARVLASCAGVEWKTMTVPRGGSKEYNAKMGYEPRG